MDNYNYPVLDPPAVELFPIPGPLFLPLLLFPISSLPNLGYRISCKLRYHIIPPFLNHLSSTTLRCLNYPSYLCAVTALRGRGGLS